MMISTIASSIPESVLSGLLSSYSIKWDYVLTSISEFNM